MQSGQEQSRVKTGLLMIVAASLMLVAWFWLDFTSNGITSSATIVLALALAFSAISWLVISRHITAHGAVLSVITGAALVIPFLSILGPMAGVCVGAVAGFVAFLFQKTMTHTKKGRPLAAAAATLAVTYLALSILMIFVSTPSSSIWDIGNGIGSWSGTPDGMVTPEPADVLVDGNWIVLFPVAIVPLVATVLIIWKDR